MRTGSESPDPPSCHNRVAQRDPRRRRLPGAISRTWSFTLSDLFKNYINGKWIESISGETFERRNPANGELVATFTKSGPTDVDAAVQAAKTAFKSWRLYPAP